MVENINLNDILSTLSQIKVQISQKFEQTFNGESKFIVTEKEDKTVVTNIDLFISDLFKNTFLAKYKFLNYYSEEDQESFKFPMIIIDPIDGTRELAKNINECAVSFGIYFSPNLDDKRNFSWIYNPFTGYEINSHFTNPPQKRAENVKYLAYVSRTEYEKNLHKSNEQVHYFPKGSIAFKLGLLAGGCGDFVITKRPKNIWDIMAGTHICHIRGISLFQNNIKVTLLEESLIKNDLIWIPDTLLDKIHI